MVCWVRGHFKDVHGSLEFDPENPDESTGFLSGYADEDPEETAGERDLSDRHALRRVAGLSTELEDVSEVELQGCVLTPRVVGSRRRVTVRPAC